MRPGSSSNSAKAPSRLARPKRGIMPPSSSSRNDERMVIFACWSSAGVMPFSRTSASTLSIAASTWSAVLSSR